MDYPGITSAGTSAGCEIRIDRTPLSSARKTLWLIPFGLFLLAAGLWVLIGGAIGISRGEDSWLVNLLVLVVVLIFSGLMMGLGQAFIRWGFRIVIAHTRILLTADELVIERSAFWTMRRTIARDRIGELLITDLLDPRVCLELVLVTRDAKTYQLCIGRRLEELESIRARLEQELEHGPGGGL